MKAVNLIPAGASRGDRARAALADGMGAYVALAMLAVLVVLAGAWALSNRQLAHTRDDLARTEAESQAVEERAARLKPYSDFAALRRSRIDTVAGLVDGRFDWSHSLREIGRVVPSDVSLVSLVGTASPSAQVEGGGAAASQRSALPVPAFELVGCARSQVAVAGLLVRLRAIDGIGTVSLASSEKSESASLNETECRGTDQMPQFHLTISYEAPAGLPAAAGATVPSVTPGATAPAAGGTG